MKTIVTPKFMGLFVNIAEPAEYEGKKNYSITFCISKKDPFIKEMRKLAVEAYKYKFNKDIKLDDKSIGLNDGDSKEFEKESSKEAYGKFYKDCFYINAKMNAEWGRPGLINSKKEGIVDETIIKELFYPGAFFKAVLKPSAYDRSGKKGVSFYLNHLMFVEHGERLGNSGSAQDAFEGHFDEDATDWGE